MSTLNQGLGVKAGGSGGGGGGTDENLGNTNLAADATREFDINGNDLTIKNGTDNIVKFAASGLEIGVTNPYIMPTTRGEEGEALSPNAAGNAEFIKTGFTMPFTMYQQTITEANTYFFPEAMSNNKFLAQTRSSSVQDIRDWNELNSVIRSCTLGVVPNTTIIRELNFWASCLDNSGTTIPTITVEIWEITTLSGSTVTQLPISKIRATSAVTGDNNNEFALGRSITQSTATGTNTLLMPVFKINVPAPVPVGLSFDVWINGSINGYYS